MLRSAFGVKYHQGLIFVNDFRGGFTLNKSTTQQTSLPLLTAWRIKQYTSDIHLGWDDLASPTVAATKPCDVLYDLTYVCVDTQSV